jgi:hypothetical protein
MIRNARPGARGAFEIDLPTGEWDVFPMIPLTRPVPTNGPDFEETARAALLAPRYLSGRAHVKVVDRDIADMNIALESTNVTGRVIGTSALPQSLRISMQPLDGLPSLLVTHLGAPHPLSSDGGFSFPSVPPGRYVFEIQVLPFGIYVSDIRVGSQSIYGDGVIQIGSGPRGPVEIRLRSGSVRVKVKVDGAVASKRNTPHMVVMVPVLPARQNMVLRPGMSNPGLEEYTFNNVPPGEYKVFAWENSPPYGAALNATFMAKYEDQGTRVKIFEGFASVVRVNWITEEK